MAGENYVWFITASSSGFGQAIAQQALQRGYKVIATARKSSTLGDLKAAGAVVMDLDVTSSDDVLNAKFAEANSIYGKITHVVNCAGYILEGMVEEASNEEVFATFNTNVLGAFNISRAAAPYLRAAATQVSPQKAAPALVNFGSMYSWISGATIAHYCSTKWAVTGLNEGLVDELGPFGVKVLSVEPGYTRTAFLQTGSNGGGSARRVVARRRIAAYDDNAMRDVMGAADGKQLGDVDKSARVIIDVLTRSGAAEGKEVPLRLMLGSDAVQAARQKCLDTLELLKEWEAISSSTDIVE
ncbi:hypothetical protein BX600DRAFT_428714 [Xylariales sp. PMI_506]|nr:hypothetical protein BX600DRAFT_428714 [Xylariales sp. PMI_506]